MLLPSTKPFKHVFTEADLAVVYKVLKGHQTNSWYAAQRERQDGHPHLPNNCGVFRLPLRNDKEGPFAGNSYGIHIQDCGNVKLVVSKEMLIGLVGFYMCQTRCTRALLKIISNGNSCYFGSRKCFGDVVAEVKDAEVVVIDIEDGEVGEDPNQGGNGNQQPAGEGLVAHPFQAEVETNTNGDLNPEPANEPGQGPNHGLNGNWQNEAAAWGGHAGTQAGANNLVNLMMRTFEMEERNRIMMNKNYHDMQNHIRQDNQGVRDFRISLQQQLLQQQSQQQLGGANAAVLHQV